MNAPRSKRAWALAALLTACAAAPGDPSATDSHSPAVEAPATVLRVHGLGTWRDAPAAGDGGRLRAWVDARVANARYHKRVAVEVLARYDNGSVIRTLHPAAFRASLGDGAERWGSDAIEVHPQGGPGGARLDGPVLARVRLQHDLDGDGRDEVVTTPWAVLHGTGTARPPRGDDPWSPSLTSPLRPVARAGAPEAWFAPFDDPGAAVIREIDRVIDAKRADPRGRHTIHAAVFNVEDRGIVDRLVAAHRAGVEVRLVIDGKRFRPEATWQTGDDALLTAGVPVLGLGRGGRGAMHLKYALFDGARLATGSFNWEPGSRRENHENMVLTDDPSLVAAYARHFTALAGGVLAPGQPSFRGAARAVFGPGDDIPRELGRILDGARRTLRVAMFTAKDFEYDDGGRRASLFQKLADAAARGVDVTLVADEGVAEGGEYFGRRDPDDPTDEWLAARGVRVVLVDNRLGQYASMHHKFVVADDEVLVTGAFNWYWDAAYLNDEDVVVWRDRALAARYTGELTDMLRRYDPAFDPAAWPQVRVDFALRHEGTSFGDGVSLVGDLPAAGAWSPARGLALDGSSWPTWRASLTLPAGVRLRYKYVARRASGALAWEAGDDRSLAAPTGVASAAQRDEFRR